MSTDSTTPQTSRRNNQQRALLDAAIDMLVQGGPDAISLRKLASKIGTSTMAIYTGFGGKEGLIIALFEEAFDRLAEAESAVPEDPNPLNRLIGLAQAYRQFALQNPSYYSLMISVTLPVPPSLRHEKRQTDEPAARTISNHPSYQYLLDAVEACIAEGSMPDNIEAEVQADALWAAVHGLCSLELAGFHASPEAAEERFFITTSAVLRGLLTLKGLQKLDNLNPPSDP